MSIDVARLEKLRECDGKTVARCPACFEEGHDKTGNHLSILSGGRFTCVQFPGAEGREHRKRIFKLVGEKGYETLEQAIADQERRLTMKATRRDSYNDRFVMVRFDDSKKGKKEFRPFHLSNSRWVMGDPPEKLPLFNLEQLRERPTDRVYLVEGEKCVCELRDKLGLLVTTSAHGAKAPHKTDWTRLAGRKVVILPDADNDGKAYASKAERTLLQLEPPARIKIVQLPDVPAKGDCVDWLQSRNGQSQEDTIAQLEALIAAAAEEKETRRATLTTPEILPGQTADTSAEAEIRGEIIRILTDRKLSAAEQRTAIADTVVLALIARGQFFFHAERRDFESAMFFDQKRKRLERIRSDAFLAWLSDWLRVNRADVLFKYVIAEVETVALSEENSKAIVPEKFWASRTGAVYLSNGDGAMVRITASKTEIVDNGCDEVLFAAGDTLRPWNLTEPQDPFDECSVFSKATYTAKHGRDLLKIFAISLPTNPASKPPLCAVGPIGSGKTRLASAVAELYGIPALTNNVEDFGEDSFWANIDAGGLFTLDNCDTRTKWLPDAVASAATAGCSQRRKKYTDSETITLRARAALCLTTANPTFASDAGLADRLLVLRMNRRTDETSDAKLSQEISDSRDAGLSFICQVLSRALADKEPTPGGLNQRHPDFAAFGVRIGRAIGRKDEVVKALKAAEQDKSLLCIETDFVGSALLEYLENNESFNGTATELRDELITADAELEDKLSVKRLGKRLDMVWPHLQKVFRAEKEKDSHTRKATYSFKSAQCASC